MRIDGEHSLSLSLVGWAALSVLFVGGTPARAEFATPIAILNATVVVSGDEVIESCTIVITDGRIVAVGPDVAVPPHAERIDATGLVAYPGFIDAFTNLGIPETKRTKAERRRIEDDNPELAEGPLPATRRANRRGIRPEFDVFDLFNPDEKKVAAYREAGFTTVWVGPRAGILSGTSAAINLSDDPLRRSVLARSVAMHASFSASEEGAYPRTVLGAIAQFRQVMLDAGWHAKVERHQLRHPNTARRVAIDKALDALQPALLGSQQVVFEANTENEIVRALNLAEEFSLGLLINGGREAWKVADRLKQRRVGVIATLEFDDEPYTKPKKRPGDSHADRASKAEGNDGADEEHNPRRYEPAKLQRERKRLWDEQVENLLRLHEAGVAFSIRTHGLDKPSQMFDNLRTVIERGLPVEAAVSALTTVPAAQLGLDQQIGRIDRGYLANITLMSGSLADKASRVRMVFIDGKKFEFDKKKSGKREKPDEKPKAFPVPDGGAPSWEVEIEADRKPKTVTGGSVLIENATILPVTSERIDNGSVLIVDGKIAAIGQVLTAPEGITVIDATGWFVIPGFVDAHSHLGLSAVNEGHLSISAEVRIADVINPRHVGLYRALAGGTTTHLALHGSANPIGGQSAILKLKYGRSAAEMLIADAPRTIKFALGENVTHAHARKRSDERFPHTRMGVEATIRAALEAGTRYQTEWSAYDKAIADGLDVPPPRRDLRLEALRDVLTGDLTVHAHCYRSEEILRLLAVAESYGFRIGTLQHVLEGYRVAPEIARHGAGVSSFSNHWSYKYEAFQAIPHNAALMTQQGLCASINSDSPDYIRYLGQEAAKSIRWGGLDERQTLSLVTINPAKQLRIDHRVGSLEVGKDGDVAIFNGHPLNTFSKCVMTLIDGEVYFEDDDPEPKEPAGSLVLPATVDTTIPESRYRVYAIVGATVHPISGPVIQNGTVVIVEDRIHAVGRDVTVPPGAGIIQATGLHVYPGLIDASTSLGLVEIDRMRETRDEREIGTLNPQVRAASAFHPHSVHIAITRAAGTTTALVTPTGKRIFGQSAVVRLSGWTAPEMLVVEEWGLHMSVPSLPVHLSKDKEKREKQKKEHKEAVKKLETFMAKARRYPYVKALASTDADIGLAPDYLLESMVPYMRRRRPVVFAARTYKQILDSIEFADKYNLRSVIQGGAEAWKLADMLAERDIPVILQTPLRYPSNDFEPWDSVYRCAARLNEAGVRFCFASGQATNALNLGINAGMAVAHGLPRERAEHALTLGAAEILGIADRVGSIEVGKQADIIVTTDTPLQTASRVTHLFIAGNPIDLANMHTRNYEKFKNRPAPKLPPEPILRGPPSLTTH